MTYQLFNEECLSAMGQLPDESVDLVLCDLPYGTTQNKWDSIIPLNRLWKEYARICKGPIVLTCSHPFTAILGASNPEGFRYEWIWRKSAATGHLNAKRMPMKEHENILVFGQPSHCYNPQDLKPFNKVTRRGNNGKNFGKSGTENFQEWTNYPRTILEFAADPDTFHPTQKPVALMEYLIETYTNPGDTVLDNTMGSGTTGVACANTGRSFIGMENDVAEGYFPKAQKRIETAYML